VPNEAANDARKRDLYFIDDCYLLGAIGSSAGDGAAAVGIGERATELADVLGRLCRAAVQRVGPGQHFKCGGAGSQVGLSDHGGRKIRDDTAGCGRSFVWHWTRRPGLRVGCAIGAAYLDVPADPPSGYQAILGDKVFVATLDAHVIALDSKTGNVVWDVNAAEHSKGYSFTLAPLVIKNLVLVGISGGEYGIRGFIDAYDAATGERKWRFYTVPGPGEPGHESWEGESWKTGGAPAWITGTYDPATNTTFWTTGNPAPSNRGEGRAGDNLYSNSLLALDPDTGNLKWHFQFTQHDEHDYDATQVPVMIDAGDRRLIAQANRNGFFYVIDRTNGKLLNATSYAKVSWSSAKDALGRPVPDKSASPTPEGNKVCPGAFGATNWMSPTYDPQTRLFYVTAREQCDIFSTAPQSYDAGHAYYGSAYFPNDEAQPFWGALRALDPATGKLKWEWKHNSPSWAGVLSTAGGLVFTGDAEGNVIALDAASGKLLWHFQCGSSVFAAPMSFEINGKQYVAVAAGSALFAFGLP